MCLPRQYRTIAGIAHGRQTHGFFERLIESGFATADLSAPAHAGRIFHLQYKPSYRELGQADHRQRKPISVGRAVERLMVLDGVLAEPGVALLGLARDNVATFTTPPWFVPLDVFPRTTVGDVVRSSPDPFPIGLAARAVSTPAGVVMEFAERGPAVADLVARTAPRPAQLTATVTLDAAGRVRHLVCRGAWTGLERSRAVAGTARAGVEARLTAAKARFGGTQEEDVKTEARRLLERHGLRGVRLDSAALQEAQGTVLWVTHGATEAGESIAVHLEPLTGKLIAFHVGGER